MVAKSDHIIAPTSSACTPPAPTPTTGRSPAPATWSIARIRRTVAKLIEEAPKHAGDGG